MSVTVDFFIKASTLLLIFIPLFGGELKHSREYDVKRNVIGWYMSEKLDGVRAHWSGSELLSRSGKKIAAPSWFTENFPPFELDGELWSGRNSFEIIQSIVLDDTPSQQWREIGYHIFESPNTAGNFDTRMSRVKKWFSRYRKSSVYIVKQTPCKAPEHLENFLDFFVNLGAEGVMIKNPHKSYDSLKNSDLLKYKRFSDMEGEVVEINLGRGELEGIMGSLTLKLSNGITFKLGSGFSKKERQNPPMVGERVTFKYYGFTKYKKPKFPSFMRVRREN